MKQLDSYGIALIYGMKLCNIYYGSREKVLNLLNSHTGQVYGYFYNTEEKMNLQLDYYRREKEGSLIHNIEDKLIA